MTLYICSSIGGILTSAAIRVFRLRDGLVRQAQLYPAEVRYGIRKNIGVLWGPRGYKEMICLKN
jgi:hypothetical protein